MGRSGHGGACLASSSLPSNMDSLERRETRAGSLSSFEMAAWQSHAACEFLSGLTLRSQADVSREQQLSAGERELDDGGSALDPAAAPGALSLDAAQSPSVAGEGGGAGLLSKEGAKLVLRGASFSKLRHGGGALPPPHDPVGSRVLLAPRAGHRPCISFSVLRFHKEVLPPLSWVVLPPLSSWVVLPPLSLVVPQRLRVDTPQRLAALRTAPVTARPSHTSALLSAHTPSGGRRGGPRVARQPVRE